MRPQSKYNASLLLADNLSDEQRQVAEQKFLDTLEQALGSASAVRGAYCEYLAVHSMRAENPMDPRTPAELQAIARWEKASQEATQSVFNQMGLPRNNAFFELHVWNSRTR